MENLERRLSWKTPYEIFNEIMNGVYSLMSTQSNIYALQKNDQTFKSTPEDYKAFTGILILSGHRPYSRQELYWSNDEHFCCPLVGNCMTQTKFVMLKKYLHFNNNFEIPENCQDRCYKLKPLFDILNNNFRQFGYFSEEYSIDKKIIGYSDKHSMKKCIEGKPVRFGFKEWALCDTRGYTFKFFLYQGANRTRNVNHPMGTEVVLSLTENLPKGCHTYFDRFFTSLPLINSLSEKGIKATGTLRFNRLGSFSVGSKEDWDKKKKGELVSAVEKSTGIICMTWKDNNAVSVMSNVHGVTPMKSVCRRVKKKQINVAMPKAIEKYNDGICGVDLAEWKTQYYRTGIKGKKWYFPLFTHCLDVAVVNTAILYQMINPNVNMDLLAVRCYISSCLLKEISTNDVSRHQQCHRN